MIKEAIVKIVNKGDLSYDEAYAVMNEIMSGETTPTQNAAFLAALSTKSARAETTDEIAGCAAAMRDHATKVDTGMDIFEIVGTGGDNAHSFNISTTSALVAAAGGMKVAKHGNRAASSQCGTADCLEALGVNIQQSPEQCVDALKRGRHVLLLRAEVPQLDEIRRCDPQGAGLPHGVQHLGAADKPRLAENAAARRVRRVPCRAARARAREPWRQARHGRLRTGQARRNFPQRADERMRNS